MMREFLALAVAAGFAAAAHAEQSNQLMLGMQNPNAPIEVTANNFDADATTKTAMYSGNVIVHQGEIRMHADAVRITSADGKADKIFAKGHVVVDAPSGTATGDDGIYDVTPRLVTLTGHVVLTRQKNVMRGTQLSVNLITGAAKLGGGSEQGTRVQGLFMPATQPSENP